MPEKTIKSVVAPSEDPKRSGKVHFEDGTHGDYWPDSVFGAKLEPGVTAECVLVDKEKNGRTNTYLSQWGAKPAPKGAGAPRAYTPKSSAEIHGMPIATIVAACIMHGDPPEPWIEAYYAGIAKAPQDRSSKAPSAPATAPAGKPAAPAAAEKRAPIIGYGAYMAATATPEQKADFEALALQIGTTGPKLYLEAREAGFEGLAALFDYAQRATEGKQP